VQRGRAAIGRDQPLVDVQKLFVAQRPTSSSLCVAAASQHFFDFSNVQLLASNFRASKFLERNTLRLGQLEQSLILTDSAALRSETQARTDSDLTGIFILNPDLYTSALSVHNIAPAMVRKGTGSILDREN
jgi:hypothetical protein